MSDIVLIGALVLGGIVLVKVLTPPPPPPPPPDYVGNTLKALPAILAFL